MAEKSGPAEGGLFASLKAVSSQLLAILQTRLELLATDVAEERERLGRLFVLALVSLFSLGLGVVLLTLLVVVLFWDTHRIAVLTGLVALFLTVGIGTGLYARHKLRTQPRLFDATITELARDRRELDR